MTIRQQYFQPYTFAPVADLPAPRAGQIVIVTQTPDFGPAHILLITDGEKTIRKLYHDWKDSLAVSPQDLLAAVAEEARKRDAGDELIKQSLADESQRLESGIAKEAKDRDAAVKAETRLREEADTLLQNALNAEIKNRKDAVTEEARVREKADTLLQDGISALQKNIVDLAGIYAPIHSPRFTGIPEVTIPDYTVPLQAVPVSELAYLLETVTSLVNGTRRVLEGGLPFRPVYRRTERDSLIKRKMERSGLC